MLIGVVVGVGEASVLLGWMMFRLAKSMDRVERDPKYKRRMFSVRRCPLRFRHRGWRLASVEWRRITGCSSRFAYSAHFHLDFLASGEKIEDTAWLTAKPAT